MSFLQYVWDKRYFLFTHAATLLFVSILLLVGTSRAEAANNLVYANLVGWMIAVGYIVIGYFYRRSFYRSVSRLGDRGSEELIAVLPQPQTNGQALMLDLLPRLHRQHSLRLQRLSEEKRDHQEFILSWIHEVKLPIAAGRMLIENSEGKNVEFLVDRFEDELAKIDHYVEQALYYSRIDSFASDYLIMEVSPGQLGKESAKKFAKLFINKGIRIRFEDEGETVQSDRKWLQYMIDQLIGNALKYTDEGGEIVCRMEEDGKEHRLLVRDTGIGIKPEELHRVFDKGFTGATGRNYGKSTGMGLYLARQLAIKLGHELSVASEEGSFTCVTIHFPRRRSYLQV
jgi:signal transduction histidine kinase